MVPESNVQIKPVYVDSETLRQIRDFQTYAFEDRNEGPMTVYKVPDALYVKLLAKQVERTRREERKRERRNRVRGRRQRR